jgi:hypothetical protein
MRRVILESPFSGDVEKNIEYAKECMWDCFRRDETPFVSHLLYTQVLDDTKPAERSLGIKAGLEWGSVAEATVVYTDRGISHGMQLGIDRAGQEGRPIEYRSLKEKEV